MFYVIWRAQRPRPAPLSKNLFCFALLCFSCHQCINVICTSCSKTTSDYCYESWQQLL